MKLSKVPLILLGISPAVSLYRCWQVANAQVQGLLTNAEAQRQLMAPVLYAGIVYLVFLVGCFIHMRRNPQMTALRMVLWTAGIGFFPIVFGPLYVLFYVGR